MSVPSFGTPLGAPQQALPPVTVPSLNSPVPASAPAPTAPATFAIAHIGQARQALADMLVSYGRLLSSNDNANSRAQLRTELAGLLVDKDPELLECIIQLAGKRRKASAPRILELFDGLTSVAQRYHAAGVPGDDLAWVDLRSLCERLLSPYQHRVEEIISHLKLDGPLMTVMPQWFLDIAASLKSSSASGRVHGMIAQSPAYMLDGPGFSQAVDALDELIVAGESRDSERLTAHICSSLNAYAREDRIKAVAGLSVLIENSMDQAGKAVIQVENALMEGCARETSEAVLRPYATYLLDRMVILFNRGYFDRAARHAETLLLLERSYRKAAGEDAMNPVREACGELSKTAWAKGLADYLIAGGEKEQAAAKILAAIDRNLATAIIGCIAREDSLVRAQAYARHLRTLCPSSAKLFVAVMTSQNDPVMLSRMLSIAPHIGGDDEILEVLYPILTHPNFELRAAALQFILDHDNERTAAFISARMRDPRSAQQHEMWMSILMKLRHPAAANVVIGELQAELDAPMQDDRRMMTLIEACNAHDDPRVAALMLRAVRTGLNESRRLTSVQRENGKALKLTAMKVLIRYGKDPRVYEEFSRLSKDPDPEIARMAQYCQSAAAAPPPPPAPVAQAASSFASGPSGTQRVPVSMGTRTGRTGAQQKARKSFDPISHLAPSANADLLFQPGATINTNAGKSRRPPEEIQGGVMFSGKQSPLNPAQLPDDLFTGMKPLLEGELQDLGLGLTARITCAKNGVMVIKSSLGNGALYIQNKVVVAAFFSGMTEIQALAAIGKLKQAKFAYFAKSFTYAACMSVEVSNIETAIREYLDMR
ncbi:MAG TPA: hypothetical protein VKX17_20330 [Planctomycetota bacterium]|nr:hypothetical protein [Planctomycetota bacterium]